MTKNIFLQIKKEDYVKTATNLPENLKTGSKLFAKGLGNTAGKLIKVYDAIFSDIKLNKNQKVIETNIWRLVCKESKLEIKIPFSKPRSVRICGLVALNYTEFFKIEIDLYCFLSSIIEKENINTNEQLLQFIAQISNSHQLKSLLKRKKQAIYDFGVLMGINNDTRRFLEITKKMHKEMVIYFRKAAKLHRGSFFTPSWPLAFKKYATMIQNGLYFDTLSYTIQEAIGEDFNFKNPNSKKRTHKLNEIVNEINSFNKTISSTLNHSKLSSYKRWKVLSIAPIACLYLTGIEAEAQVPELADTIQNAGFNDVSIESPAIGATTIALVWGSVSGEDASDNFPMHWSVAFSSLIPTFTA